MQLSYPESVLHPRIVNKKVENIQNQCDMIGHIICIFYQAADHQQCY